MPSTTPTAGGILAAAAAMQDPNRATFTHAEVAYLMHLAYDAGRTARYVGDIAELHAGWARNPIHRPTAAERHAARMADMDRAARQTAARRGEPYRIHPGGPVDWETGRPVRHLEVAA